jgi:hypothetical protein
LFPIKSTRLLLKSVLGGAETTKSFVNTVLNNKGILIQSLLYPVGHEFPRRPRPSGYHHKLSLQSDSSDTKLKLRSVIRTNGLALHLLAYDTKGERKTTKKGTGSATAAGKSGLYDVEDDDDADFGLDAAFLDHGHRMSTPSRPQFSATTSSRWDSGSTSSSSSSFSDPTASSGPRPTTATSASTSSAPASSAPRTTTAYDPGKINFARGSKTLTNVEVKFASSEDCPEYKDAKIVGVDLGERISFCATRIGPKEGERIAENEGQRETVYIRRN